MNWYLNRLLKRNGWRLLQPFFPIQRLGSEGVRSVNARASFFAIRAERKAWKRYIEEIKPFPGPRDGTRGIVICAGGICYITCAWVNIKILRKHGCRLPIEIWYLENE